MVTLCLTTVWPARSARSCRRSRQPGRRPRCPASSPPPRPRSPAVGRSRPGTRAVVITTSKPPMACSELLLLLGALLLGELAGVAARAQPPRCPDRAIGHRPSGPGRPPRGGRRTRWCARRGAGRRSACRPATPTPSTTHAGQLHRAGRGGEHREEPGGFGGRRARRPCSRRRWPARTARPSPGRGRSGESPPRRRPARRAASTHRSGCRRCAAPGADRGLARAQPRHLLGRRRSDLDHHVGGPGVADRRPGVGVELVGRAGHAPRPDSTTTWTPLLTSAETALGTNATRRSSAPDSATTPTVVAAAATSAPSAYLS